MGKGARWWPRQQPCLKGSFSLPQPTVAELKMGPALLDRSHITAQWDPVEGPQGGGTISLEQGPQGELGGD